jgi:hypothetical protein
LVLILSFSASNVRGTLYKSSRVITGKTPRGN